MYRNILKIVLPLLLSVLFSCTSQKKLVYFQGNIPQLKESDIYKLRIYPGDILSINIFTINAEAYPYLAVPADKPSSDNRSAYEKGYIVNENGEVKLPLIGSVLLTGKTMSEATQILEAKFKEFMEDPIVTVKKLNFKVTVLGEVNRPGTYPILNEHATLPEVLGMAGDLSVYGDRQKVRIIREENQQTKDFFIDMTNASSLSAETYYLHPDDIIYVQPLKRRAFQNISPSVTIFTSIVTTAVIALTFIITQTK
ncbi:MAG: polysaccharide export protein [Bacteroidetes bacterium]|nr:polysaccharide export protein [Bacteroidota bacterium]MBL0065422.1 polysaccharide export protein [Bacteroidota bacterium]MBL0137839.1 polysaccharide export protein [Bacteroidota bacterium]